MYQYNREPLTDISTDWLRSHLRYAFDQVRFRETRYRVLRRGRPVAGIVPVPEARALYEATRVDRAFRDVHLQQRIETEDLLRTTLVSLAEAEEGFEM